MTIQLDPALHFFFFKQNDRNIVAIIERQQYRRNISLLIRTPSTEDSSINRNTSVTEPPWNIFGITSLKGKESFGIIIQKLLLLPKEGNS